jgi:hypothetical protein
MQEIGKGNCIQLANEDRVQEFIDEKLLGAMDMVGFHVSSTHTPKN